MKDIDPQLVLIHGTPCANMDSEKAETTCLPACPAPAFGLKQARVLPAATRQNWQLRLMPVIRLNMADTQTSCVTFCTIPQISEIQHRTFVG